MIYAFSLSLSDYVYKLSTTQWCIVGLHCRNNRILELSFLVFPLNQFLSAFFVSLFSMAWNDFSYDFFIKRYGSRKKQVWVVVQSYVMGGRSTREDNLIMKKEKASLYVLPILSSLPVQSSSFFNSDTLYSNVYVERELMHRALNFLFFNKKIIV